MLEKLDELDLNRGIESKEKRVLNILFLSIFAELNLHKFFLDYSTGSISKEVSDEISQIKKFRPDLFMKETEVEILQEIQMSVFRVFYYLVHKYIPHQTYSPQMVFDNLAEMMGVSAASTTEMIQRLANRDLVTYIPYKGSRLTTEGFSIAGKIKRRQLLIEMLLTDVIGFQGDIHAIACEMEHAINNELEAAIDSLLGYPEETKSGERIPQVARHFETNIQTPLLPISNMPNGSTGEIEFIALSGQESKTLDNLNFRIGNFVSKTDDDLYIDTKQISLSDSLSKKILVRLGG